MGHEHLKELREADETFCRCTEKTGDRSLSVRQQFQLKKRLRLLAAPLFLLAWYSFEANGVSLLATIQSVSASSFGWLILSILSSYGLGDVVFLLAARKIGILGALAIASAYPIWTGFLGALFLSEPLNLAKCIGIALAVAGIVVVILVEPDGPKTSVLSIEEGAGGKSTNSVARREASKAVGILLAVLTSLFWALNSYSVAKLSRGLDPFFSNFLRMALSIPICLFGLIWVREKSWWIGTIHLRKHWPIFLLESFGGSAFFVYGLGHSSLAVGATLSSLAPVVVVPVAWVLRLERVSIRRLLAVLAVALGISLLLR
jgi:drug/metabolite transporter (DMT)-like permease